jgi:Methyltransferase domain
MPQMEDSDKFAFSDKEFRTLVALAKRAIRSNDEVRRAFQKHGVNIIPATFYSDIPTLEEIDSSFEWRFPDGPYNSRKIFDPEALKQHLTIIDRYADEFAPPSEGDVNSPNAYYWGNPAFSFSDAMAYYCMLRHTKPAHVLEVGSGFSTLVALEALKKNGTGRLSCIEPYPKPWLESMQDRLTLHRSPAQTFEPDFFNDALSTGDVFFIDSTHTVKAGSDCLHLYLRVLPELENDVTVHAHDIYLPFPLARSQANRHVYWTEQYLLYAYLLDNPRAKVVFGSQYHSNFNKDGLTKFMRGRWAPGGASIWFSLKGRSSSS